MTVPTFTWRGETLDEFHHLYNMTWKNERAVELAVVRRWLLDLVADGEAIRFDRAMLEVGNVTPHYWRTRHPVVDRFEPAAFYQRPGQVLAVDVLDAGAPSGGWPAIVSISTLEHVGWDEPGRERDPGKSPAALARLVSLLARGGRMLVTFPVGHHPALDELVTGGWAASWSPVRPPDVWTSYAKALDGVDELGRPRWVWVETGHDPLPAAYGSIDEWAASLFVGEWVGP